MSDETTNKFSLVDMPDSIDNAVKNLTDVPTKNAGQTFGDLWYLVFGGITHAADKRRMKYAADLEKFHQELTESIDKIPDDKKVDPSIQITAQALENSKYCVSSESLRNMFTKLISGTMNKDYEPLIHPSFPEMIKQMSTNDAHILMELKRKSYIVPVAEFREVFKENGNGITHFTNAYISDTFKIPLEECSCSLSSLERMGLVSISFERHLIEDSLYKPFYKTSIYQNMSEEISSINRNSELSLKKGICSTTPLGKRFIAACVS
ncbi:DUF4393 domain-containing protein [Blautia sp. An81]|uniref:DUF4393 domain-containing protein n=1 Tax=Blautia sp. An81 TaxID=1965659 RepID=UPI0013043C79|nr:DUF4393 domain-containing protein [Blautia sp. An81]